MKRYIVLVAAVLMQMCLGATYSWSIYVQPLRRLTGMLQGPAQMPFTLFYFAFPATMVLAGQFLPRLGPRRCAMLGGILFGGGWLLAGLGGRHYVYTVLGIGFLAGVGAGFAYIVPIAICIRWFPKRQGLVTGIAVAGFGGGAAVVSQIGGWLMGRMAFTPFATFALFGSAFLVVVVTAGAWMTYPTGFRLERLRPIETGDILGTRVFWLLYAAMVTGLAAGFTVNANMKDLYPDGAPGTGTTAVALFALANAAGRIGWGWLFDRLSPATMIRANLLLQAAILLSSPLILQSGKGFWVFAVLTGFNYGGVLVIYASSAARLWGGVHVGQVYGWLFSANIPAAVAPLAAGFTYDFTGGFYPALACTGLLMTAAAVLSAPRRLVRALPTGR